MAGSWLIFVKRNGYLSARSISARSVSGQGCTGETYLRGGAGRLMVGRAAAILTRVRLQWHEHQHWTRAVLPACPRGKCRSPTFYDREFRLPASPRNCADEIRTLDVSQPPAIPIHPLTPVVAPLEIYLDVGECVGPR